jgi:hypothetical protein
MGQVNSEGLTWPEWAYAAAVPEPVYGWVPLEGQDPRCDHGVRGKARFFRKERAAWRRGEDPSEWRKEKR